MVLECGSCSRFEALYPYLKRIKTDDAGYDSALAIYIIKMEEPHTCGLQFIAESLRADTRLLR
jgi:hypothetical protein